MTDPVDVVYRGPFQTRRIRLVLDTVERLGRPMRFIWIDPKKTDPDPPQFFTDFLAARASLVGGEHIRGHVRDTPSLVKSLRAAVGGRSSLTVAIGFTALYPARLLRPRQLVWCINGIPEERLLYDGSRRSQATVEALWKSARLGPAPDVAITVSRPMSAMVRARTGANVVLELPTAVDRAIFRPQPKNAPPLLNYVGSGAPWQNLGQLGAIWREVAARQPETRFLVVSRDDRAAAAIEGIDPGRASMVAGHGPDHVAELTAGATLGFVVRQPHIVNEVSYPTKFGEYVASGTGVVSTDIGWDLAEVIRETGCGLLVDWRDRPERIADEIVEHLAGLTDRQRETTCDQAAKSLDRDQWIATVGHSLQGAL